MAPSWLSAFVGTLAVETPVYWFGVGRRLSGRERLGASLLVNVATHPLAWWFTARQPGWERFAAAEVAVLVIEAALWSLAVRPPRARQPMGWREASVLSLSANALSAGIGLLAQ